jgi:mRNA-degrading endonuclease RelE of RelBE toxin-antitoxin system
MKIKAIPKFRKELKDLSKKYRSLPDDFESLLQTLLLVPFQGTPLGKNCYKIRLKISSKNTGKSGGARVITHVHVEGDTVTLLSIYDKSEQADISDDEIATRLKEIL